MSLAKQFTEYLRRPQDGSSTHCLVNTRSSSLDSCPKVYIKWDLRPFAKIKLRKKEKEGKSKRRVVMWFNAEDALSFLWHRLLLRADGYDGHFPANLVRQQHFSQDKLCQAF